MGNECSAALVRIDGSIDWCCLPFLDSPSVFGALLDARRGGYFLVHPTTPATDRSQRYVDDTNVLVTVFETDGGRLEVWDYMPAGGRVAQADPAPAEPSIYRHVRCAGGWVEVEAVWVPRLDYGRGKTHVERSADGFLAHGYGGVLGIAGLEGGSVQSSDSDSGPVVVERFHLEAGEERVLRTTWDDRHPQANPKEARVRLESTIREWRSWVERAELEEGRAWAGAWQKEVVRSELLLKLMTQPRSGALAAAPTTSLPETIGGVRNWDYRFAWIRDSAQIAQAFFAVGHPEHVDAFIRWAEKVASMSDVTSGSAIPILHPLRPDARVGEVKLDHLEGYRGSRPVRVGNAAADQVQLDVYGELLNAVSERVRLSEKFDPQAGPFLSEIADAACRKWRLPDFGIWEMKNGPSHQVYSKAMVWTALHRALWLEEEGYLQGAVETWRSTMERIREEVLRFGYDEELGSFVQRYGAQDLDAANLLLPMMEFLPPDDPRVQSTIDRTLERLTVNDLVYRYRTYDGLPGEEGCFVLATFWLVDALALSDRLDEANRVFESLLGRVNHLGLLSEQIDPYSGEFLGNFPQAYSHLGLINSTLYLGMKEGRDLPVGPLLGARAAGTD